MTAFRITPAVANAFPDTLIAVVTAAWTARPRALARHRRRTRRP